MWYDYLCYFYEEEEDNMEDIIKACTFININKD